MEAGVPWWRSGWDLELSLTCDLGSFSSLGTCKVPGAVKKIN